MPILLKKNLYQYEKNLHYTTFYLIINKKCHLQYQCYAKLHQKV